jgi:hypothetical protein
MVIYLLAGAIGVFALLSPLSIADFSFCVSIVVVTSISGMIGWYLLNPAQAFLRRFSVAGISHDRNAKRRNQQRKLANIPGTADPH